MVVCHNWRAPNLLPLVAENATSVAEFTFLARTDCTLATVYLRNAGNPGGHWEKAEKEQHSRGCGGLGS